MNPKIFEQIKNLNNYSHQSEMLGVIFLPSKHLESAESVKFFEEVLSLQIFQIW